ncbi:MULTISPECIES: zinc-binding alcohol dehydrogenase family protein [Bacillus]|uniref:Zinc-type alcohol dehydrogenase-like protein n=2 Tax=Bacillus TaxID=1386 RepID=A0A0M3RAT8_9BACI|nr:MULTISPECIES: zinc-binding alcohol dehydrogenase family protein [Bacillus]ALC83776.1 NADPH:quinone reductase [Bacillus gobiensis]MBP1083999.1 zinc-binding alcohol dehydrogenase family protein [Bacillus capparidis]MED1096955.1 zinc-binding alcohol dehydrogenase family protein [Bacillus capparidis]
MKAVGLYQYLPIENEESLLDVEVPKPKATGKDLLVKINAISVNPVDTKVRAPKDAIEKEPKILGWDASGVVEEVGEDCELFQPGDTVFYAGDITRQGSYSEYQLIDERIVGKKPSNLSFAEAAAMPLTTITAWEGIYERLGITEKDKGKTILIINGAGGVGSIATQIAKYAGLKVIATASREETKNWCEKMGADVIINHRENLLQQLNDEGIGEVDYIFCLNDTDGHWDGMGEAIKPQGSICSIVENEKDLDLNVLKSKSVTFVWEFMYTRSMFQTEDMIEQHRLLNKASDLFEEGIFQTTLTKTFQPINAEQLKKAHKEVESGKMIGKLIVENEA